MRTKLMAALAVVVLMVGAAGCGGSKSKADTLDGGWSTSPGLAKNFDATNGVAVSMSATLCAFNPAVAAYSSTTGLSTSTLSCYLGAPSGGATPVALRVVGAADGTDYTLPLTAVTTPGWHTQAISWSLANIREGVNSYTVWYTMSDGTESNRSTVNLTFGSATATGDVTISTAVISPDPASIDLSQHLQTYDTALTFDLYLATVDPASPLTKAVIQQRSPRRTYTLSIPTAPTAAGWLSLAITAPLPGATGVYKYDIYLETAEGKRSNTIAAAVPVIDSSQNPYGGTAVISNAYFETNPLLIDFAAGDTTGTSTEQVFINNLPTGKIVKAVWLQNTGTLAKGQGAVTAQPAFPGWMSVTWTFYANAAGNATYDCWLEMEDGTVSNTLRLSITFAQL